MIKNCYMTKEDLETWSTDPKNYVVQKSKEINYFGAKRYRTLKLVSDLLNYTEKKNKKIYLF